MARSDLVVALAQAGNAGDRKKARVVTEAIIAEERAKQHTVFADKLSKVGVPFPRRLTPATAEPP